MRNSGFYVKHKIDYRPLVSPFFNKANRWRVVLLTLGAVLIGPSVIYKRMGVGAFSFDYYLQLVEYFLFVSVPFVLLLFWLNWREAIKRRRGYNWVGKFEVMQKQSSLGFRYLQIAPGESKLRVEQGLFDNLHVGDFIVVRRDSLGHIEEIKRDNFQGRLARNSARS